MTGYGQAQHKAKGYNVMAEVKSVNHRFLDINVRMPRRYMLLEEKLKEAVKGYAVRGRFDINITIEAEPAAGRLKVDKDLAMDYYNCSKELAEHLGLPADLRVIDFIRAPDIFTLEHREEDAAAVWEVMEPAFTEALEGLAEMRQREGEHLAADLRRRNQSLLQSVHQLEQRSPEVVTNHQQKLLLRLGELLPEVEVDQQRLLQEIAFFADRSSITEEIVRLRSHVGQFDMMLASGEVIGRKSDFLLQEMFREINTVASKSNDLTMSQIAVEVKTELEKIREQIQNIE
jgi:uncharacterized protein (TIGR00255 family)